MTDKINILAKKKEGETIFETLLKLRGITNKEEFLDPENKELAHPEIFSDIKKAVEIIKNSINKNEKILIWGDFDADGVTSTSILYKTLKHIGADVIYFLPERIKHGHGINLKELLTLKSKNNIKVLITVDCGISNAKEINLIKSMGVKTIVTDHHEPPEILPEADCILNPLAKNSLDPNLPVSVIEKVSYMSGAGVALKLAYALLDKKDIAIKEEILALSCVGTIADVVPLVGENRIIAAKGLKIINRGKHKGIKRLFDSQNVKNITSTDVAFILAPRINSAGRLDTPFESIKLLIEEDEDILDMVIEKLNGLNCIRQSLCEKTYEEALSMLTSVGESIVLFNKDWHIGIIGITASKLVERFNVPAFLITMDDKLNYRCSIRGTKAFDIAKILKLLEENFIGYGGHMLAGGFSANSSEIEIEELKTKIEEAVAECKDENAINMGVDVDMELEGGDITLSLMKEINKLEPFGERNKRPVFLLRGAKVISQRNVGRELNHINFKVAKDYKEFCCLFWHRKSLGVDTGDKIDFVFKPELNTFNDETSIRLIVDFILNDKFSHLSQNKIRIFDHRQKTGIMNKINDYIKVKNGDIKVWANSIEAQKLINSYPAIAENTIKFPVHKVSTVMFFDYPTGIDNFKGLIKALKPKNIHFMNTTVQKNPNYYITSVCGMIKYASNNKEGKINTRTLALKTGLNEMCIYLLLELLEKIGCIKISGMDKIVYIKAPKQDEIRNDACYEIFEDEFNKVINFKEYLYSATISEIEEICRLN